MLVVCTAEGTGASAVSMSLSAILSADILSWWPSEVVMGIGESVRGGGGGGGGQRGVCW